MRRNGPYTQRERVIDPDWPECVRCGSEDTTVVPKSGEWTCGDCGCQWTAEETPEDTGDADSIPDHIEGMLRALLEDSR